MLDCIAGLHCWIALLDCWIAAGSEAVEEGTNERCAVAASSHRVFPFPPSVSTPTRTQAGDSHAPPFHHPSSQAIASANTASLGGIPVESTGHLRIGRDRRPPSSWSYKYRIYIYAPFARLSRLQIFEPPDRKIVDVVGRLLRHSRPRSATPPVPCLHFRRPARNVWNAGRRG